MGMGDACLACGCRFSESLPGDTCPRCGVSITRTAPTESGDSSETQATLLFSSVKKPEDTSGQNDCATLDWTPSEAGRPGVGRPEGLADDLNTPPSTSQALDGQLRRFGDFTLINEIARGGMGVVYKARQESLKRIVALKMILAGKLAGELDVQRFRAEAEAAALLDHPGIVPVYEFGEWEGQHYFSMGFVDGPSLAQAFDDPYPPRQATELMVKVCDAVEYAHRQGVVHRDLKPANVLLEANGNPRISDFGLAKRVELNSGLTVSGQIMGTPSYMPPEQALGSGSNVTQASDIYSLGAILYELLTGRPPFQSDNPMETLRQVLHRDPIPPRQLNSSVPRDLETVCLKCLNKEPRRRYESADALADELRRYLAGQPIHARPISGVERAARLCRRNPTVSTSLGAVVLSLAAGLGAASYFALLEKHRADELSMTQSALVTESNLAREFAQKETAARRQIEDEQRKLQRQLYISAVNLAYRDWEYNDVHKARTLLESCAPEHRGWEWYFCHRLCRLEKLNLAAHEGGAYSVAFAPDGSWVASVGMDEKLKIHDASTGELMRVLSTSLNMKRPRVYNRNDILAVAPDGRHVAVAWSDDSVAWMDLDGSPTRFFLGHESSVTCLEISPDGTQVAAGSMDGVVRVWDTTSGDLTRTLVAKATTPRLRALKRRTKTIHRLAFDPTGERLAAACMDGAVRIWQTESDNEPLIYEGHRGFVFGVAFSPDGQRVASGGWGGAIHICDAVTGARAMILQGHDSFVHAIVFSADGRRIASSSEDRTVRLWDASTGEPVETWRGHDGFVMDVAINHDATLVASAGQDGTIRLWDASAGRRVQVLDGHTGWTRALAFSPDSRMLATGSAVHSADLEVFLWNTISGRRLGVCDAWAEPGAVDTRSVTFSSDGQYLVAVGGGIRTYDVATGSARSPNHVSGHQSLALALAPDGERFVVGEKDGTISVWRIGSDAPEQTISAGESRVQSLAFNQAGTMLAASFSDGTVRMCEWDADCRLKETWRAHTKRVNEVAFSPDDRLLASASWDGVIKVWSMPERRLLRTLTGHSDEVYSVAFSPDGARLVSCSLDRTIKLWDTTYWDEVFTLRGHRAGVVKVVFSPNGRHIASGSIDFTARLWTAPIPASTTVTSTTP